MINMKRRLFGTAMAALISSPAWAQEMPPPTPAPSPQDQPIGEIIVTAEKRSTVLQETPLAITAVTSEVLENRQIANVSDLTQLVPNVNFGQTTGNARIAIRGVGFDNITVGNEGRVAYHVDGVYLSRPVAALGTFFDAERLEVLRGPQGTLYGRNATAGAVNLITRDPEGAFGGYARLTVGNYDLIKAEGAANLPLSSTLAARLALQTTDRDGYGKNVVTNKDVDDEQTRSARSKLRWNPSAGTEVILSGDYHREKDSSYGYHYLGHGSGTVTPLGPRLGGYVAANPRDLAGDIQPTNRRTIWGTSLTANVDIGPTLTSITGYRNTRFRQLADLDTSSVRLANFDQFENSEQISQELRLSDTFQNSDWLLGAYYFEEKIDGATRVAFDRRLIGQPAFLAQGYYAGGSIDTTAMAAFGQLRLGITDKLSILAAARYSTERKRVDEQLQTDFARAYTPDAPVIPIKQQTDATRWNSVTPKVGLEYKASEDVFLYALASKGFKSGGYNLGGVQPAFKPETIWDYEAGIKSDLAGGRIRANVSAFYYDYKNLQVSKVLGTAIVIENAAAAELYGVEGEFLAVPTDQLKFDLNVALIRSRYKTFQTADPSRPQLGIINLQGNQLTQAPDYTVTLGGEYTWNVAQLDVTARVEGYWADRVYFSPYNLDITSQPAHSRFNAYLNLESLSRAWTASLFVRNIANQKHVGTAAISTGLTGFPAVGTLQPPRTFGIQIGRNF